MNLRLSGFLRQKIFLVNPRCTATSATRSCRDSPDKNASCEPRLPKQPGLPATRGFNRYTATWAPKSETPTRQPGVPCAPSCARAARTGGGDKTLPAIRAEWEVARTSREDGGQRRAVPSGGMPLTGRTKRGIAGQPLVQAVELVVVLEVDHDFPSTAGVCADLDFRT